MQALARMGARSMSGLVYRQYGLTPHTCPMYDPALRGARSFARDCLRCEFRTICAMLDLDVSILRLYDLVVSKIENENGSSTRNIKIQHVPTQERQYARTPCLVLQQKTCKTRWSLIHGVQLTQDQHAVPR